MKIQLFVVACAAAFGLVACSGSSSNSSTSGSGSGSTTGSGTTTSSSSGSGGTTGGAALNGCSAATAQDFTNQATAHVTISGFAYSPACIKVSTGTVVTIDASSTHPLSPGADCTAATSGNPITAGTSAQAVTFTSAGSFGFFCQNHCASNGMKGAVFVQ